MQVVNQYPIVKIDKEFDWSGQFTGKFYGASTLNGLTTPVDRSNSWDIKKFGKGVYIVYTSDGEEYILLTFVNSKGQHIANGTNILHELFDNIQLIATMVDDGKVTNFDSLQSDPGSGPNSSHAIQITLGHYKRKHYQSYVQKNDTPKNFFSPVNIIDSDSQHNWNGTFVGDVYGVISTTGTTTVTNEIIKYQDVIDISINYPGLYRGVSRDGSTFIMNAYRNSQGKLGLNASDTISNSFDNVQMFATKVSDMGDVLEFTSLLNDPGVVEGTNNGRVLFGKYRRNDVKN